MKLNKYSKYNCNWSNIDCLGITKKKIIKGTIKYSDMEILENAVVIIYKKDIKLNTLKEEGYTTTNERGEFIFVINICLDNNTEYILEIFEPLVKMNS